MPLRPQPILARLILTILLVMVTAADGVADGDVCRAGDPGVASPRLLPETRLEPLYPEEATAQGRVVLQLLIETDGRVAAVEPVRVPYGGEDLGRAAEDAVRAWRYEPAVRDGATVACWVTASLEFYRPTAPPPSTRKKKPKEADDGGAGSTPGRGDVAPEGSVPVAPPPAPPARDPDGEPSEPLPLSGTSPAAAPTKEPDQPDRGDRVIDPFTGGPAPLLLAASAQAAADYLGVAIDGGRVLDASRGIDVRVGGNGTVVAIRYVYRPTGEFGACLFRTRSGLGGGSLCVGIPPAQGRPDERTEEDGVTRLVYAGAGSRATFSCVDGRLAELLLESGE